MSGWEPAESNKRVKGVSMKRGDTRQQLLARRARTKNNHELKYMAVLTRCAR
jgi:hypothetical protein